MMREAKTGQAFLGLVLFIGITIILVGLLLAFLASSFVDTGYGYRALTQAEAVAQSGVQDALLQLDRNSSFRSTGGYSVAVGSNAATVTVTNGAISNQVNILSSATVSNRTRKINVVVAVNASSSQITIVSSQFVQ